MRKPFCFESLLAQSRELVNLASFAGTSLFVAENNDLFTFVVASGRLVDSCCPPAFRVTDKMRCDSIHSTPLSFLKIDTVKELWKLVDILAVAIGFYNKKPSSDE